MGRSLCRESVTLTIFPLNLVQLSLPSMIGVKQRRPLMRRSHSWLIAQKCLLLLLIHVFQALRYSQKLRSICFSNISILLLQRREILRI